MVVRKIKIIIMMKTVAKLVMVLLLINASCSKKASSCPYDPCSPKAPDAEVAQVQAYLSSNNITAVKHCSGLFYQIMSQGSGVAPSGCSAVVVNYKGALTNGKVFDQSVMPFSTSLIDVIKGWQDGLPLIQKGGKIKLFIPPSLGYGPSANGDIPANSILIFDVELLDLR